MANKTKNDAPAANAGDQSDGTDRTSALGGDLNGSTDPAAPGARETLDPESDEGKAAAADKSARLLPAEDQTDKGTGQPAEAAPAGTDPSVAERLTVRTTGNFMLQDPYSLDTIDDRKEGVPVVRTSFIDSRLAAGQLEEV